MVTWEPWTRPGSGPFPLPSGLEWGHVSTATLCPGCDLKGIKGAPTGHITHTHTHTHTHTELFLWGVEVRLWLTVLEVQAWVGR